MIYAAVDIRSNILAGLKKSEHTTAPSAVGNSYNCVMSGRMYRRVLSTLFPRDVATADLWNWADVSALDQAEPFETVRMSPKRRREYAAGRQCGRRALGHFGFSDVALGRDARGLPQWPDGTVGSITHTHGYAAAVVAKQSDYIGLGVDAETIGRLTAKLWPYVFTEAERAWLSGLDQDTQSTFATVIFSAKEAFYKSQFIAFGARLGFRDIEVKVGDGTFEARAPLNSRACHGTFCVTRGKVLTAALIPQER